MTILTQTNKNEYIANGSMNAFEYTYIILDAAHMVVYLDGSPLVGGYSVSGVGSPTGGTVTLNVAPASGVVVTLLREVPLVQQTDYTEYDAFPAETHERALDKLTLITQQLSEKNSRQLARAPGRPDWDAQGRIITNVADPVNAGDATNKEYVDDIKVNIDAQVAVAVASSSSAANSANSAQQSSSSAANSAQQSSSSAANSANSAQQSAVSAQQSAVSAQAAQLAMVDLHYFLDEYVSGTLAFPLDLGWVYHPFLSAKYNLGTVAEGTTPPPPSLPDPKDFGYL